MPAQTVPIPPSDVDVLADPASQPLTGPPADPIDPTDSLILSETVPLLPRIFQSFWVVFFNFENIAILWMHVSNKLQFIGISALRFLIWTPTLEDQRRTSVLGFL